MGGSEGDASKPRRGWNLRRKLLKSVAIGSALMLLGAVPADRNVVPPLRSDPVVAYVPGEYSNTLPPGYLHTDGAEIVSADGKPVRLVGANWYGFESTTFVAGGLDKQPLDNICTTLAGMGFNTVRLPFSVQEVLTNPKVDNQYLAANPQLQGKTSLEVMDVVIDCLHRHGMRVILDNHRSSAGWSAQENGLWYTPEWGEASWIEAWRTMALRYKDNDAVIGADLRNEPDTPPTDWRETLSSGGSLWGDNGTNVINNHPRDWAAAAERGGDAVLAINPHLLIFVEGVRWDPAGPKDGVVGLVPLPYWPGGNLTGVREAGGGRLKPRLIHLSVPHQLVYSAHDYGPAIFGGAYWLNHNDGSTETQCREVWDETWGFIVKEKIAPVWIGEFGTPNGVGEKHPEYYTNVNPHNTQGSWFSYLTKYINDNNLSWSYWDVNGNDSYGLLNANWNGPSSLPLMAKLQSIERPLTMTLPATVTGPADSHAPSAFNSETAFRRELE